MDYRKVGNYYISNICLESYPCQHTVCLESGVYELTSGAQIYRLLMSKGLSDPHFDKYKEYVRKIDFPTPEQKKEAEEKIKIRQQLYEKRKNRIEN